METIRYARAAEADAQQLTETRIRFLLDLQGQQPAGDIERLRAELLQYFHRALADDSYICQLAFAGREIVGVGGMAIRSYPGSFRNPGGRSGYIMNMYTRPDYRRQGICTTLLERLIADGRAMGIAQFELHATAQGEPVYLQAGFGLHKEPTYRKTFIAEAAASGQ